MVTKERIRLLRLMKKLDENPDFGRKIGVSVVYGKETERKRGK